MPQALGTAAGSVSSTGFAIPGEAAVLASFRLGRLAFEIVPLTACAAAERVGTFVVAQRRYAIRPAAAAVVDDGPDLLASLTPRELEIALLVAAGEVNKSIAGKLGISCFTVGAHMDRIFRKLGVHNRAALAASIVAHLGRS